LESPIDIAHAISAELGVAVEAALLAGECIRERYQASNVFEKKAPGDWLSEVDLESDRIIRGFLERLTPQIDYFSEESQGDEFTADKCWIVDPLDGTSAFIFKTAIDQPSVMIALNEYEKGLQLGVVYFPLTDEVFFAEYGKGAFYNKQKLEVPKQELSLERGHVILNHYGDSTHETIWFNNLRHNIRKPGGAGLVTIEAPHSGVACRLIQGLRPLVAIIHDNSPNKPKQELWDIAAPKVIVEESGGVFCNASGVAYGLDSVGPIIIARNKLIAQEVIRLAKVNRDEAEGL
jgi:myo-inositol-1(or 4)-monophosphatase